MIEPAEATPDATDEQAPEPAFVLEFEGQPVEKLWLQVPASKLEVTEAFARGTFVTLRLEYRVRNVRYEEDRKGVLARHAVLVLDGDAAIVSVDTAEDRLARAVENGEVYYSDGEDAYSPEESVPGADLPALDGPAEDSPDNPESDGVYDGGIGGQTFEGSSQDSWEYDQPEGVEYPGPTAEVTSQSVEDIFA